MTASVTSAASASDRPPDRLGVTCIWLMPFSPPDRDDGYDISDFYGVDPRLGTLGDFVEFMRTARTAACG